MTPGAFIGAILVAVATMMPAHARTEVMGGGPSHRGVSHGSVESSTPPDDGSTVPKSEAAAGPGGAIYTPFAEASNSHGPHEPAAKQSLNADDTDLSLTVIAALVGVAVFAYILR